MKKLIMTLAIILGLYLALKIVFTYVLQLPIPDSVMEMYIFFIAVGTLMAVTADEGSTAGGEAE